MRNGGEIYFPGNTSIANSFVLFNEHATKENIRRVYKIQRKIIGEIDLDGRLILFFARKRTQGQRKKKRNDIRLFFINVLKYIDTLKNCK